MFDLKKELIKVAMGKLKSAGDLISGFSKKAVYKEFSSAIDTAMKEIKELNSKLDEGVLRNKLNYIVWDLKRESLNITPEIFKTAVNDLKDVKYNNAYHFIADLEKRIKQLINNPEEPFVKPVPPREPTERSTVNTEKVEVKAKEIAQNIKKSLNGDMKKYKNTLNGIIRGVRGLADDEASWDDANNRLESVPSSNSLAVDLPEWNRTEVESLVKELEKYKESGSKFSTLE